MKRLFALVPVLLLSLVSCGIPDDGKSDIRGTVAIDPALLATVVMPDDPAADADCLGAAMWGDPIQVGDVSPTLYVGIYARAIDPSDDGTWFAQCGEVDDDGDPGTPPVLHEESCPLGGTTGVYHAPTAAEPWTFEFTIRYVERGVTPFLYVWLDNKCAAGNDTTSSLVWDLGGPPDGGDLVVSGAAAAIPKVKANVVNLPAITLDAAVAP